MSGLLSWAKEKLGVRMIHYKSEREISKMRRSADLVSRTLAEVGKHVAPGVKAIELDRVAEDYIRTRGAEPAFKGHQNGDHVFPATLCVSVNDAVVHGIPSDYVLQEGDLLSIDCGVLLDGFIGDSAYTFAVGEISERDRALCRVTYESLYKGIEQAVAGNRLGDIGHAVETHCAGYGVVEDLCGHGVGRTLWEEPQVPHYGEPGKGKRLKPGLTLCIEPMVNTGTKEVTQDADGWTIRTADGSRSAHYEHMIVVREGEAEILSTFAPIEAVVEAPYRSAFEPAASLSP